MSEREKIIETMARAMCCDPQNCEAPKCGCAVPSENARYVIAALDAAGYAIVRREPDEAMIAAQEQKE